MNRPVPEPRIQPTAYAVSCLPEDDVNARHFTIKVEYRGHGLWGVFDTAQCLGVGGEWDYEPIVSERDDTWITAHRFDLDTALRLAATTAPLLTCNGHTVADALEQAGAR